MGGGTAFRLPSPATNGAEHDAMITRFSVLYVGQIELDHIGRPGVLA